MASISLALASVLKKSPVHVVTVSIASWPGRVFKCLFFCCSICMFCSGAVIEVD